MRNKSLRKAQKVFAKTMDQFISINGRPMIVLLPQIKADCPNCINDYLFGQGESANIYNTSFLRPVNIFPGTTEEAIIYPKPFNVDSVPSGIVYDPSDPNPKILNTTICPVCKGDGTLSIKPEVCINGNWNWGSSTKDGEIVDYSAGEVPHNVGIIKTDLCNYAICRDAKRFIIDGVECEAIVPPIKKGVGTDAFIQIRVQKIDNTDSTSRIKDKDKRLNVRSTDSISDQSSVGTPHSPPNTFSHEDW